MDIINPFITSTPVRGDDFFGRADTLENIHGFLQDPGDVILLIFAQRRLGKTSLLRKIQNQEDSLQSARPVYFNLQDKSQVQLSQLLRDIAERINTDLDLNINLQDVDFIPDYFQKQFLPAVSQKIPGNKSLLLLLDEADVMEAAGEARETAARQFIPFLENLAAEIRLQKYRVKIILAVGRDFRFSDQKGFEDLEKWGAKLELPCLSPVDTQQLLTQLSGPYIPFVPEAAAAVYALTSGHPYLTQCLAKTSFEAAVKEGLPQVTPDIVHRQIIPTIKTYSSGFYSIWDSFPAQDQVILYLMASHESGASPGDYEINQKLLQGVQGPAARGAYKGFLKKSPHGRRRLITREIIEEKASLINAVPALINLPQVLERLQTGGIIVESPGRQGEYYFGVELIRKWIVEEISEDVFFKKKKQLVDRQDSKKRKGADKIHSPNPP